MDRLARLQSGRKHLDGDLLQALSAEAPVELLDAQLARHAERLREFVEESFVRSRLSSCLIGKALQEFRAFALLNDSPRELVVLLHQGSLKLR
jgi:hypothetical protein